MAQCDRVCFGSMEVGDVWERTFSWRLLIPACVHTEATFTCWPIGNIWFHSNVWYQHVGLRGPGITKTVRWIRRGHERTATFREKTQPENNLTTFYLCLRSRNPWAPRRPCCTWRHAYRKHFMHACVWNMQHASNFSDSLNDLKLLIFRPLGEQGGWKSHWEKEKRNNTNPAVLLMVEMKTFLPHRGTYLT